MTSLMPRLPWHHDQWLLVHGQLKSGRRPHAMLLTGASDLGKRTFAHQLAAVLLCRQPDRDSEGNAIHCGNCASCHLVSSDTHPDFMVIEPTGSKQIVVDQIRELNRWVSQTSNQGGEKVTIIHPAEQMNLQASNALLKSLEEPTPNTMFLLVSDQFTRLLPTIRSRCQRLSYQCPTKEMALSWLRGNVDDLVDLEHALALAAGSPLKVLRDIDGDYLNRRKEIVSSIQLLLLGQTTSFDVSKSAEKHKLELVQTLQTIINDAILYLLVEDKKMLTNSDAVEVVRQTGSNLGFEKLYTLSDKVLEVLRELESTSNPNPQLLAESLLIAFSQSLQPV